jgi:uncharacterized protein (DUF2235 family)
MTKRLVVCCDGTWNTPDQAVDGRACPTNVTKLALAVAGAAPDGTRQVQHYLEGVGTRRWERLRGGAFGMGLSRNVKDAYRFLVDHYEPGDEIFLFGFSRGAFTARSLGGLIRNSGILRPEHDGRIEEAYRLYRDRAKHPRGTEAQEFRRAYSHEARIRFIGVWDTVGALGIPLSGLRWVNMVNRKWQFHDTTLSSIVQSAFQALAVDERRKPFEPAVWKPSDQARDQQLEQVWFAGDHCDVGGGHADGSLADVALLWMRDRARACGLAFDDDVFQPPVPGRDDPPPAGTVFVGPDPMGKLHNSRTAFYRLLRPYDRPIGRDDPVHEAVAATAVRRHERGRDYAPSCLVTYLKGSPRVVDVQTRLEPPARVADVVPQPRETAAPAPAEARSDDRS